MNDLVIANPYLPLIILGIFIVGDLLYIASQQKSNTPSRSLNSSTNISPNTISQSPFLQTYLPSIILIVVVIIGLLVIFSMLGISFDHKIKEKVSKIITVDANI